MNLAEPSDYVTVSSGLLLLYGVGAIVGPFVASAMITFLGSRMLFVFAASVHALLFVFALTRLVVFDREDHQEQVEFSDALTAVQTASQVYEEEVWHSGPDDDIEGGS